MMARAFLLASALLLGESRARIEIVADPRCRGGGLGGAVCQGGKEEAGVTPRKIGTPPSLSLRLPPPPTRDPLPPPLRPPSADPGQSRRHSCRSASPAGPEVPWSLRTEAEAKKKQGGEDAPALPPPTKERWRADPFSASPLPRDPLAAHHTISPGSRARLGRARHPSRSLAQASFSPPRALDPSAPPPPARADPPTRSPPAPPPVTLTHRLPPPPPPSPPHKNKQQTNTPQHNQP